MNDSISMMLIMPASKTIPACVECKVQNIECKI